MIVSLQEELTDNVKKIFKETWTKREGQVVPESDDITLNNDAVLIDGTVLYADLNESTNLVNKHEQYFSAEIYKAYLHCAAKIINNEGGIITAYDGDRIMSVFIGKTKNTDAARTGLKINWVVKNIINPAIKTQYPKSTYEIHQVVGIDTSSLFVARTGVRGSNDLVWVGRAANFAAKLSGRSFPPTQITADVYNMLHEKSKYSANNSNMWIETTAPELGGAKIYTSSWLWELS